MDSHSELIDFRLMETICLNLINDDLTHQRLGFFRSSRLPRPSNIHPSIGIFLEGSGECTLSGFKVPDLIAGKQFFNKITKVKIHR